MLEPRCWRQVHQLVRRLLPGTPPSRQGCSHRRNHRQCRDTHLHLLLRGRLHAIAMPLSPWPFQVMSTTCHSSLVPLVLLHITKKPHTSPTRLKTNSHSRLRCSPPLIFPHHVRSGLALIKACRTPRSCQMGLVTLIAQVRRLPNDRLPRRLKLGMHRRNMSTNSPSGLHQTVPTNLSRRQQLCHLRPSTWPIHSLCLLGDPALRRQVSK
jgi:hypothetical protein